MQSSDASEASKTPTMTNNNSPLTSEPLGNTPSPRPAISSPWSVSSGDMNLNPPPTSISPKKLPTDYSPHSVLSTLPTLVPSNPSSPVSFFHLLERLKTTKREGWRRFGITAGESISDHMYRMSILTMLAPPSLSSRLNVPHCTKMALVHDMAEALVGDITPVDNVSKTEKNRREADTMEYLTGELLGAQSGVLGQGKGMLEIWEEYEEGKTLEAVFVKDVDKVELVLQMMEYERAAEGKLDLGQFVWVTEKIQLEEVKGWCREILREREEFWKGLGREASGLDCPLMRQDPGS